ncbi:hypothetical protein PG994_010605 [Apiospora phragmitis]|uniref:Uncharacterized protein n=1 Tax=Apiospora phragmitis TaxID=2905665 RepID=A0ABR1TSP4_9PEZI
MTEGGQQSGQQSGRGRSGRGRGGRRRGAAQAQERRPQNSHASNVPETQARALFNLRILQSMMPALLQVQTARALDADAEGQEIPDEAVVVIPDEVVVSLDNEVVVSLDSEQLMVVGVHLGAT